MLSSQMMIMLQVGLELLPAASGNDWFDIWYDKWYHLIYGVLLSFVSCTCRTSCSLHICRMQMLPTSAAFWHCSPVGKKNS